MSRLQLRVGSICYWMARSLFLLLGRIFWSITIEGREHVPAGSPYVLAPVHRSNVDFLVAALVTRDHMGFMGKDSLFSNKAGAWIILGMGAFPVHRGTPDRESLRVCEDIIRGGKALVMFPEGTRCSGPIVQDLFDGPAFVAGRTSVPIIPVGIGGSEAGLPKGARMIRRARVHVVIGPPIEVERSAESGRVPRRAVREATEHLHTELQRLFDLAEARGSR